MTTIKSAMQTPAIVSPADWETARRQMLVKEKALLEPAMRWPPNVGACRG